MSQFYRGFASAFLFGSLLQYYFDQPIGALHSVAVAVASALLSIVFRPAGAIASDKPVTGEQQ